MTIQIGLHLHENLGLAYSLAQDFLDMKSSDRNCVIDASMLGMGRVPGNLCLELIMDYMNREQGGLYDVNPVLDGIDDHIVELKKIEAWGYNTAYALSAKYNLHRNYAEYLVGKGRLRAKQINQILGSIEDSKKTAYDEAYIEKLYEDFQNRQVDDTCLVTDLRDKMSGKRILIIAPGSSIIEHENEVRKYIENNNPVIISANFIPEGYECDYAFFSNAMRYSAIEETGRIAKDKILITSNLMDECDVKDVINYSELSVDDRGKYDNCVIMLLRLLIKLGIKDAAIAGFDGYENNKSNYVSANMVSQHTKGSEVNLKNREHIQEIQKRLRIEFITPSMYL